MHPKFKALSAARSFARLMGLAEKHAQEVLDDPMPHLQRAERMICQMRKAIEEAERALIGTVQIERDHRPPTLVSIAAIQNERILSARKILRAALAVGESGG